ncbi:hypothetical protein SAMN04487783_1600 [Agrococcus baldri]|uniref:Peptidase C-terminal archaeal/bacterial domain-containing protein n=1 Tax=Agrococcus baldri TaxID=153730 RepID=A0AA94KZU7_9MICO|nr:hypothetical protein [Agrococcus baldri]SFS11597.1 hypothetical protein SAMN04487783_1600 [Agrococcus baldri]
MGRAGRAAGAVGVVAIIAAGLTGCIPGPPPVPQPTPAAPIVQSGAAAGELREGFVPAGGTSSVTLTIDERAAVAIGATSPDEDDLTMHLTGAGTDVESDDASGDLDVFEFEMQTRDPAIATVLEPGEYTIELAEWGDDSTDYRLQVLTSTTTVTAGSVAELEFGPGRPALVIATITEGDEAIAATSDIDTTLWAYVPDSDQEYWDDDGGGDRNPRIELIGESPQDIAVVATGYDRDESGTLELAVE